MVMVSVLPSWAEATAGGPELPGLTGRPSPGVS